MDLHRQIGRNLRAARVALGWSLAGVAYRMDVRENTVSRWETGERRLDVETLYRVAKALGRDPRDLLPEPSADAVTPTVPAIRNGSPEREGNSFGAASRRAVESRVRR